MKRHYLVFAGIQQLCDYFFLRRQTSKSFNANSSPPKKGAKSYDLRHSRGGSSAPLRLGLVQQVWRERVKFGQLVKRVVPLDLLLVHHSVGQRLFGHLPVVDLFLHGALQMENDRKNSEHNKIDISLTNSFFTKAPLAYLSQEAIDEHWSDLAKAVHPVNALHVIRGIPGHVKDHHPAGRDQVDAQ